MNCCQRRFHRRNSAVDYLNVHTKREPHESCLLLFFSQKQKTKKNEKKICPRLFFPSKIGSSGEMIIRLGSQTFQKK